MSGLARKITHIYSDILKEIQYAFFNLKGGFGYGKVTGMYRDHKIEIKVNRGYNSLRGLSGFIVSEALLNSAIGVLGGMKNFTSVTIYYNAHIMTPDKLDDRTLVDENKIVYLPSSEEATGLPKCGVTTLIKYINKIIIRVKQIERDSPISTDD